MTNYNNKIIELKNRNNNEVFAKSITEDLLNNSAFDKKKDVKKYEITCLERHYLTFRVVNYIINGEVEYIQRGTLRKKEIHNVKFTNASFNNDYDFINDQEGKRLSEPYKLLIEYEDFLFDLFFSIFIGEEFNDIGNYVINDCGDFDPISIVEEERDKPDEDFWEFFLPENTYDHEFHGRINISEIFEVRVPVLIVVRNGYWRDWIFDIQDCEGNMLKSSINKRYNHLNYRQRYPKIKAKLFDELYDRVYSKIYDFLKNNNGFSNANSFDSNL